MPASFLQNSELSFEIMLTILKHKFMDGDLIFFYGHNVFVFPTFILKNQIWTFFLSIFHFPKKVLEKMLLIKNCSLSSLLNNIMYNTLNIIQL